MKWLISVEKTGKQIKTILEYIRIFITVFLPDIAKIFADGHIGSFEGPKIKFLNKKTLYLSKVLLYLSSLYVLEIILWKYARA